MNLLIVYLVLTLFFTLSVMIPIIGGLLGDLLFRFALETNISNKPCTFAVSWIPILGPFVTSIILLNEVKCNN